MCVFAQVSSWLVLRYSFHYAGSVSHPFYAPLNLRADKLVILIIFFLPNNEEFFFHGTSLEICAVSNF